MKHTWLYPVKTADTWNVCSCGFVANDDKQVIAHNRSNRNYRKRKKRRQKTHTHR